MEVMYEAIRGQMSNGIQWDEMNAPRGWEEARLWRGGEGGAKVGLVSS